MNILLAEPEFPVPAKSKNHSSFLPIGLLKIGSYHQERGDRVQLVRGHLPKKEIKIRPDVIKITSIFSYWSEFVGKAVHYYRSLFPHARIEVGGIFASLMPDKCKELTGCDAVAVGLYRAGAAEDVRINYSLLPEAVDYQIIHASRGCTRRCIFCGVWKIEPECSYKGSIIREIESNWLVFYDNNLLANPYIEDIFNELSSFKFHGKQVYSESQSGIDGRLLQKRPHLANMLKAAKFINPRIAWDSRVSEHLKIKNQIDILKSAGYRAGRYDTNIYLFMLYNHNICYEEMSRKLDFCRKWGVITIDCRFRPLNSLIDHYNPRVKFQEEDAYYIHKGWSDSQIRSFRRKVRRQNIAIRLGLPGNRYIEGCERRFVAS